MGAILGEIAFPASSTHLLDLVRVILDEVRNGASSTHMCGLGGGVCVAEFELRATTSIRYYQYYTVLYGTVRYGTVIYGTVHVPSPQPPRHLLGSTIIYNTMKYYSIL